MKRKIEFIGDPLFKVSLPLTKQGCQLITINELEASVGQLITQHEQRTEIIAKRELERKRRSGELELKSSIEQYNTAISSIGSQMKKNQADVIRRRDSMAKQTVGKPVVERDPPEVSSQAVWVHGTISVEPLPGQQSSPVTVSQMAPHLLCVVIDLS